MPAFTDRSTRTGAGVRNPPRDETAGERGDRAGVRRSRYGDFAAGSDLRVAESSGGSADFAASMSRELVRHGTMRILRDEVMWF